MLETKFGEIPGVLNLRSNHWYYHVSVNGVERRINTRRSDRRQAETRAWRIYQSMIRRDAVKKRLTESRYTFINDKSGWDKEIAICSENMQNWLGYMHRRSLDRARRKGIFHSLTYEQLITLAIRSDGQCQVTGIPFSFDKSESCRYAPFSPALDRIDPGKGYTSRNCRLVCNCVNAAMGEWGEDVLFIIADAVGQRVLPPK